jgi:hypothetical protein
MELKTFYAQDVNGNVIPSPTVYIYTKGTTTPIAGLEDDNGDPLTNPFTGAVSGLISVAAPSGEYDMRVTGPGRDTTLAVQFIDVTALAAAADESAGNASASAIAAAASAAAAAAIALDDFVQVLPNAQMVVDAAGLPTTARMLGPAPNQAPLNANLAGMAYQSPESVVIKPQASAAPTGIGEAVFQLTSDTSLEIKVKGSDGTVRSVALTLA